MNKLSLLALLSVWLAMPILSQSQTSTTQSFTITVNAAPCTITISTSPAPPAGIADGKTAYGPYTFTAATTSSCTLPLVWSVAAGTLPTGLTLNASTGTLSGTISTSDCTTGTCTSSFTIKVTDSGTGAGTKLVIKMDNSTGARNDRNEFPLMHRAPFSIDPFTATSGLTITNARGDEYAGGKWISGLHIEGPGIAVIGDTSK
jgi:hypothetical protein